MVERFKQQYDLAVLRLYLDRSDPEQFPLGQVVFEFEQSETPVLRLTADAKSIGVPASLQELRRQYHYSEPNFQLPSTVRQNLSFNLAPQQPLWLELARPYGNLPVVPWERLLHPHVQRPILRLPYFTLQPTINIDSLELVLCASTPEAKSLFGLSDIIERITRIVLESLQMYAVVHIFTDMGYYSALQERLRGLPANPAEGQVILHNPQETANFAPPGRNSSISETPGQIDSPWLRWMSQALAGRGIDIVHFICHGYLSSDQGVLAFAETPLQNVDQAWARFVGAQQLTTFLTQSGAWGITFTSPESNFSKSGLRLLADQIARLRPGTVLLHEADEDDNRMTALASAYRFLLSGTQLTNLPDSAALNLYCHPAQIQQFRETLLVTKSFQPVAEEYLMLASEAAPLLSQALQAALNIQNEKAKSKALVGLAPYLAREQLNQVFRLVGEMENELTRLETLVDLAPWLTTAQRGQILEDILATESDYTKAQILVRLAPYLTQEQVAQALRATLTIEAKLAQIEALAGLAPYLTEEQLGQVLQMVLEIEINLIRAKALADLAPSFGKMGYTDQILPAVLAIESESFQADALAGLGSYLSNGQVDQVLKVALSMRSDEAQAQILVSLVPRLTTKQALSIVLRTIRDIENGLTRVRAITGLLPHLKGHSRAELLREAFQITLSEKEEWVRAESLVLLAPHLGSKRLGQAVQAALAMENEENQAKTLVVPAPYLSSKRLEEVLRHVLSARKEEQRLRLVGALAPYLKLLTGQPFRVRTRALLYARFDQVLFDVLKVGKEEPRLRFLGALAPLEDWRRFRDLWQVALTLDNKKDRAELMVALAPHLDGERLAQAFQAVLAIPDELTRAEALSRLAPYLPREPQQRTPGWVASSLRFVEQSTAQYLEQPPVSETHSAVHQGVTQALSYLSDVIYRHSSSASMAKQG